MTKLEDFVNYAKSLSPEDLKRLEWKLDGLMKDSSGDALLTAEQEAATLSLAKNPNIKFAPEGKVEAIFAKYK